MYKLQGVNIPDDKDIITDDVAKSIRNESYENAEVTGLPKFIKADDRVIELGSGIGFISTFLAKRLGVRDILCVEANPRLCDFIKRVHAENGVSHAEVVNAVAMNDAGEAGEIDFFVREPFWSSSLDPKDNYERAVKVSSLLLSEMIRDFRPNTLIVDIEGGEIDLFEPLDLTGVDKVYLEVHTRKTKRVGVKSCFDALSKQDFGYEQRVSCGGSVLFKRIPKRQLLRS